MEKENLREIYLTPEYKEFYSNADISVKKENRVLGSYYQTRKNYKHQNSKEIGKYRLLRVAYIVK